jgi:hypothetical protein
VALDRPVTLPRTWSAGRLDDRWRPAIGVLARDRLRRGARCEPVHTHATRESQRRDPVANLRRSSRTFPFGRFQSLAGRHQLRSRPARKPQVAGVVRGKTDPFGETSPWSTSATPTSICSSIPNAVAKASRHSGCPHIFFRHTLATSKCSNAGSDQARVEQPKATARRAAGRPAWTHRRPSRRDAA